MKQSVNKCRSDKVTSGNAVCIMHILVLSYIS